MKGAHALFPVLFSVSALAAGLPAAAAEPATGSVVNAVTVSVAEVTPPATLPGLCRLRGEVGSVLEGEAFKSGQTVTVSAPCRAANPPLLHGYDVDLLKRAKFIGVQIDAAGQLLGPGVLTDYGGGPTAEPLVFITVDPA